MRDRHMDKEEITTDINENRHPETTRMMSAHRTKNITAWWAYSSERPAAMVISLVCFCL